MKKVVIRYMAEGKAQRLLARVAKEKAIDWKSAASLVTEMTGYMHVTVFSIRELAK